MFGLAYRTDFDLRNHAEHSGADLRYTDPATGERFFPHVIEPTFGLTRLLLMVLLEAYHEEDGGRRVVLKLAPRLAPYKVAVFPLLANKPELVARAREIHRDLLRRFPAAWDDRGNIGKRYYSQDEIGTPWCITVDFQTLEDGTVTLRDRDTAAQVRVPAAGVALELASRISAS
ncbi:MAG: anticodon-binding protein [Candidatus Terrybacteria bacterium]|nr:anticodon-binding protein [Candidatus Terrybacteria bacterium]